ncbi:aminomethyl-transferring glycine dehydrogenase subunit GcvPA [uncultured Clostridium sp.]|uniref:aminomethyl-transferring glycine dehydrogenase subunit GcvPA n=1 Tax=uncultured Clostridium sp. TaxID=59620 RepID=UPI0025CEBC3A|nr:aminomethyl-transferring glycine dehydrogenase subunit GcvPA [uncultured Clostridium sp.]
MHPYLPLTDEDRQIMLKKIGINKIDDLFSDIPESIRLKRKLDINDGMSELEVKSYIDDIVKLNRSCSELTCFLGAGAYDHYIPSIVRHIISRSEFYTAYTPYQAEISQGTLQSIFEYQTVMADLTGMDVSNASMYDGATACVEAAQMAANIVRRKKIIVSKTVNPEARKVLETYLRFKDLELVEIDETCGVTDIDRLKAELDGDTAAVIVQTPNFFGIIEELEDMEKYIHKNRSLLIVYCSPISLGILKNPGECGADIAVGEGQPLGSRMNYGGPYFGFLTARKKYLRKIPGRIVGETTDREGKRGFVLTLQAREQHIRREKASSNICSNEALNALAALIYLVTLGKEGIREVACQNIQKAHYAFKKLTESGKYKPVFNRPFFNEFLIRSEVPVRKVNEKLLQHNILGGYEVGENSMILCVTEKRTKSEIDKLVSVLEAM